MISISGKKWTERNINSRIIEKTSIDNNFTYDLSKLVLSRNYTNTELNYLKHEYNFVNPFLKNNDFISASKLLLKILQKKGSVLIYGDYDVDGVSSTSILVNFLNHLKNPNYYIIPNRFVDGYGPNLNLIKKKLKNITELVIFVDCGSNSIDVINFLKKKNIEVLIIDHHFINNKLDPDIIMINPMKNSNEYMSQNFCSAALTFYLIDLINTKIKKKINIDNFLFFAFLGTICDLMPLRHQNRLMSKIALNKLSKIDNPGIKNIINFLSLKRSINYSDVAYSIGPMINSPGRLKDANLSVDLFCTTDENKIKKIISEINLLNIKRKEIEKFCVKLINTDRYLKKDEVIFEVNSSFHEGILGIVAGKLKDKFNKPAFIFTNSNDVYKGSARSTNEFKLNSLLNKLLNSKIIDRGGGHNTAAGFVINKKKINIFKKFVNDEYLKSKKKNFLYYDFKKILPKNNSAIFTDLKKLEPFGNENLEPLFLFENVKSIKAKILNCRHINCILKSDQNRSIQSIAFDAVDTPIGNYLINFKKRFNLIGTIDQYLWDGKKKIQIIVKDLLL